MAISVLWKICKYDLRETFAYKFVSNSFQLQQFFSQFISFKLSYRERSSYGPIYIRKHQRFSPTRKQNIVYDLQRIVPVISNSVITDQLNALESMCTHFIAVSWFHVHGFSFPKKSSSQCKPWDYVLSLFKLCIIHFISSWYRLTALHATGFP